mmetsp:Transcript_76392/g.221844  ORF Transcript_76392/g.221844 Transcript_76392/m.221844 type:complete len:383 (-) Transcript_76392:81-1229(-)
MNCTRNSSAEWILCCSSFRCARAKEWLTRLMPKVSVVKKHNMRYNMIDNPTRGAGMTRETTAAMSSHPDKVMMPKSVSIERPMEPNHSRICIAWSSQRCASCPNIDVSKLASTKFTITTTTPIHKTAEKAVVKPQNVAFSSPHTRNKRSTRSARIMRKPERNVSAIGEELGPSKKKGSTTSKTPETASTVSNKFHLSPQNPRLPPKSHIRNNNSKKKNAAKKNSHRVYAANFRCAEPFPRSSSPSMLIVAWVFAWICSSMRSFTPLSASMPCCTLRFTLASSSSGTPMMSMSARKPVHCGDPLPRTPRSASKAISTVFAQSTTPTTKLKQRPLVLMQRQRRPGGADSAPLATESMCPLPVSSGSYTSKLWAPCLCGMPWTRR